MFRDAQDFLDHRTIEAEVDRDQYVNLLRWLTFVSTKGDHSMVFAQKDSPDFTWQERRSEDDLLLGTRAFPYQPDRGLMHIQLFAEGHPTYSPLGINAIVGNRDEEGVLRLCILSTDGEKAWANMLRGGDPLGRLAFTQLIEDFHEVEV